MFYNLGLYDSASAPVLVVCQAYDAIKPPYRKKQLVSVKKRIIFSVYIHFRKKPVQHVSEL